ncbi:MAG: hypothetical protein ACYDEP_13920 [Acidimicrobiales bacterium]
MVSSRTTPTGPLPARCLLATCRLADVVSATDDGRVTSNPARLTGQLGEVERIKESI